MIFIQGILFDLPFPYSAGMEINELEAETLNRVYRKAIYDNLRLKILDLEDDMIAIKELVEDFTSTFELNPKKNGMDWDHPIVIKARSLAETHIIQELRKKGIDGKPKPEILLPHIDRIWKEFIPIAKEELNKSSSFAEDFISNFIGDLLDE